MRTCRFLLNAFACASSMGLYAQAQVTLSPLASPSAGEPGVTSVNVTGSNFPNGTILPASVTVTLTPAGGGNAVNTVANAVTTIVGTTSRVTFTIPASISVTAPTAYNISIAGMTSGGAAFASSNTALLTVDPVPGISNISPTMGQQGQTLSVTITGLFTNFVQGATQASFGAGIGVGGGTAGSFGPVTIVSPTSATATVSIAASAALGARTVTLETGTDQETLANGFTVTAGTPIITQVSPNAGQQSQTLTGVAITGAFTHFTQASSTVTFSGTGVVASSVSVTDNTHLSVTLTIAANAAAGSSNVSIVTGSETATGIGLFVVGNGTPAITSVNPNSGPQGQTLASVAITGTFTHFTQGTPLVTLGGTGIVASNVQVTDNTHLSVTLTISGLAALGPSNITVVTGAEIATGSGLFSVSAGIPVLLSANPISAPQGQTNLSINITGQFTHFVQGTTTANFGAGITVGSLTVNSATGATAVINVDPAAAIGIRNITLTTNAEVETLTGGFTVTKATPVITSVNPASGRQGQTLTGVLITGAFTHFTQATPTVSFSNTGVVASNVQVIDNTHLSVTLTIAAGAAVDGSNVTVATGSESASGTGLFTVTSGIPVITQVNPNSGQQGQTLIGVVITGAFTHFIQGISTVVFSNPGVVASSVGVTDNTHLSLNLTIAAGAAAGGSTVTVVTGTESASGPFTVISGTPVITQVSPAIGQQGQTLTGVAIIGALTHFTQGTPTVTFGNTGVVASNVQVSDNTHLSVTLTIAAGAAAGGSNVTVVTGSESASGVGLFTVTSAPVITQVNPNSGQQGQTLTGVAIIGALTHFTQGTPTVTFSNTGVVASNVQVTDNTHLTATLTVSAGAAAGSSNVTVVTGSESASGVGLFTVASAPVITQVSPNSGQQGQTLTGVAITGAFTHFTQGTPTVTFSNTGVVASNIQVTDNTHLTATLTISAGAAAGGSNVTVVTGSESASGVGLFTVASAPVITQVNPNSGQQGQTLTGVAIIGALTHFTQGTPTVTFSNTGVVASNVQVTDNTHLTATLTISAGAAAGGSNVTVVTGSESASGVGLFTVASAPVITQVNPNSGQQGQTLTGVAITGAFTHFTQSPPTVTFSNTGIVASGVSVTDNTHLTATLTIAATAATGASNVTVVTGAETAMGTALFTVTVGALPTITDFNPKSAPVGTLVTITGTNLQPNQGTAAQVTLAKQGGGTIAGAVSSTAATSLSFVIPAGAATGTLFVTVNGNSASAAVPLTIVPASTFTLTALPSPANLIQGQSTAYAVSVSSTTGFNQLAALSVTGMPSGVTAAFQPQQITAGQTSVLTISAPAGQAASSSTLTVSASAVVNGISVVQSAPVTLNVQPVTTSFLGRTVVSDSLETTLVGVTIKMLGLDGNGNTTGCTGGTVSDGGGNFLMTNLPPMCVGPQLISFDGTTVTSPSGKYAGVNLVFTFASGQVTVSPVLVHLPRIDNVETFYVTQNSASNQSYSFTTIPGLSVTVYAGTTFTLEDGTKPNPFPLAAVQVPADRLPDLKPNVPTMIRVFIVAFQPANATTNEPVAVYFPNTLNTSPGTDMVLMTLDPTHGQMVPYGTGAVSSDGTQIVPDSDPAHPGHLYGLVHFDWHGPMPASPVQPNPAPPGSGGSGSGAPGAGPGSGPSGGTGPGNGDGGDNGGDDDGSGDGGDTGDGGVGTDPPDTGCSDQSSPTSSFLLPWLVGSDPVIVARLMPPAINYVDKAYSEGQRAEAGDPVDLSSGIQTINHRDIVIKGSRSTIALVRTYRSLTTLGGPFGIGTSHNFNYGLNTAFPTLTPIINLIMPDGNRFPFSPRLCPQIAGPGIPPCTSGRTNSTVPALTGAVMTVNSDESTDLRWKNGTVYHFVPISFQQGSLLASITDRNGNTTTITHDASGNVTSITDPVGRSLFFNYDSSNRVTSITDPIGRIVMYTYNTQGSLATFTNPAGGATQYRYDANNNLLRVTDPRGIVRIQNTLDSSGRVTQQVRADGGVLTFSYTAANPIATVSPIILAQATDSNGVQATYRFNMNGFVTDITNTQGETRSFTFLSGTNFRSGVVETSVTTTYTYDATGNVLTSTDPTGLTTTFTYEPVHNKVASITDPLGNVSLFTYDANGNLLTSSDPDKHTTSYQYDPTGLVTQMTDALGQATQYAYDSFGNLTSVTDALGNTTSYAYDAISRLSLVVDALGRRTSYTYDPLGHKLNTTDAKGGVTASTYDPDGNLVSIQDARGNTNTFSYDPMSRLVARTDALGRSDARTYDTNGNLLKYVDRRGQTSTFTYDNLNRLATETYSDATVARTYDFLGRLYQVNDSAAGLFAFNRDLAGRLLSSATPNGAVNYTYDGRGLMASRQVVGQAALTYAYDPAANLTGAALPQASATFAYNPRNQIANINRANGVFTAFTYDLDARLSSLTHAVNGSSVIDSEVYGYDAVGNRNSHSTSVGQALITQPTANLYDTSNELTLFGSVANGYDSNGNLAQQGTTATYTWDGRSRLKSIVTSAGQTTNFTYDFAGNLIQQADSGTSLNLTKTFVLDDLTNVAYDSATDGSSFSVLSGRSIDSHLAIVQSTGQVQYGLTDAINSTVATVNQSGAQTSQSLYEPYGQTTTTGTYPFQFTGRMPVSSTTDYYRARFYNSQTGRFISEDPIGLAGGPNMYSYALNNPVGFRDPLGLAPKCLKWIILAGQLACEIWGIDVKQDPIPDPTPVGITQPAPPTGGTGGKGPPDDEPIPIPSPSFCPTPGGPPILSPFPIGRPIRGPILSPFPGGSPFGLGLHP